MEQNDREDSVSALEEWYSTYMSVTEHDIDNALTSWRLEPSDLEAVVNETLEAMKDITVIGGFCSTCQAMLESWPDFKLSKNEEGIDPTASTFSWGPGSESRFFIHPDHGITARC